MIENPTLLGELVIEVVGILIILIYPRTIMTSWGRVESFFLQTYEIRWARFLQLHQDNSKDRMWSKNDFSLAILTHHMMSRLHDLVHK